MLTDAPCAQTRTDLLTKKNVVKLEKIKLKRFEWNLILNARTMFVEIKDSRRKQYERRKTRLNLEPGDRN